HLTHVTDQAAARECLLHDAAMMQVFFAVHEQDAAGEERIPEVAPAALRREFLVPVGDHAFGPFGSEHHGASASKRADPGYFAVLLIPRSEEADRVLRQIECVPDP